MFYELVTLEGSLMDQRAVAKNAIEWIGRAQSGRLLGSWRTDIGTLGRVFLLRSFETQEELADERHRALKSCNPFDRERRLASLKMETFEGFPFLGPATPRQFGGIYELRTYVLKPGGLPPTLDAWEDAIEPAREYTDHLVVAMFALDGEPRIKHIWGFRGIDERTDLLKRHHKAGLWPPKGGPNQIAEATSQIILSNTGSPLA